MSLYTALKYMQINGFVDVPGEHITIYKITCVESGHFYIGQSNDLQTRVYSHFMGILDVVKGIASKPTECHLTIGQVLLKSFIPSTKKKTISIHVRSNLNIFIIALAGDRDTANLIEGYHIGKGLKSHLCLNKSVRSYVATNNEMIPFKIINDNGEKVYLSQ